MKNYLEFEKEIKTLEEELDGLKSPFGSEGISEVDTKKILVQYRSMVQNLVDAAGMPKLYYRNYVEKGPFLKQLIGSAALENPVTSS